MKKIGVMVLAACTLVAACGDDNGPASPSTNAPVVFTALLSPANEVPAVSNSESSTRGAAQITFDVTRDSANAITAAGATFYFQVTGLQEGTNILGAHIHTGGAGVNGPIVVNTGLSATSSLAIPAGTVEYRGVRVAVDPTLAQSIVNNPGAFYFNVHTPANPGGVARGQLVRIQ